MFAPRTPRTAGGGGAHGAEEKSLSFALRAPGQSTVQLAVYSLQCGESIIILLQTQLSSNIMVAWWRMYNIA